MVALRPCPVCSRHARVSETACPFCGARLGEAFGTLAAPRKPAARLSRAALFAMGAGGLVVACGGSTTLQPPYGTQAIDCDAESVACGTAGMGSDAGPDVTTTPMPDASAEAAPEAASSVDASAGDAADADLTTDAAEEQCEMVCALYGLGPGPSCSCE
jgi:hypothetical protein